MNNKKIFLYGFLVWLIPFLFSFIFYTPEGELSIGEDLFKSVMVVVSTMVGVFLLSKYFITQKDSYLKTGITIGVIWFAINIVLDFLVLIPMSGMSLVEYWNQIGLRYLGMPIMAAAFGYLLEKRS